MECTTAKDNDTASRHECRYAWVVAVITDFVIAACFQRVIIEISRCHADL